MRQYASLVPRPPPFIVLRFSFSIIHGSRRARKTGKAWEHLSREWRLVDARWTYGGRGPRSNNALDFIIECSNDSQDSWGSQYWQNSTSLVRNSLYRLLHELVDGQCPPYVHLASTRCHSRDRCSQAFPVFCALPLLCIILNENRRTKNGGGLGTRLAICSEHYYVSVLTVSFAVITRDTVVFSDLCNVPS